MLRFWVWSLVTHCSHSPSPIPSPIPQLALPVASGLGNLNTPPQAASSLNSGISSSWASGSSLNWKQQIFLHLELQPAQLFHPDARVVQQSGLAKWQILVHLKICSLLSTKLQRYSTRMEPCTADYKIFRASSDGWRGVDCGLATSKLGSNLMMGRCHSQIFLLPFFSSSWLML